MNKRNLLIVAAALLAFGLFRYFTRPVGEKAAILAVLRAEVTAIEEQDTKAFMSRIAPDFTSNIGGAKDYESLMSFMRGVFFTSSRMQIRTRTSREYVELDPETGDGVVELELSAWRRKAKAKLADVVPANARRFRFEIRLKKVDGRWKIYKVTQLKLQQ